MYNQFRLTLTTPSMLTFYGITIIGAFFISSMVSVFANLAPLLTVIPLAVEGLLDRGMVFTAFGILAVTSILAGYFDVGPAAVLETSDEYIMMPAPVLPHQLFISRYVRRLIRKLILVLIGLFVAFPLLSSAEILFIPTVLLIISLVFYFETNYFLGGFVSTIRSKLNERTQSRLRHLILPLMALLIYIPTLPEITQIPLAQFLLPSNAMAFVALEVTGFLAIGLQPEVGAFVVFVEFLIVFLVLANIVDHSYYERFSGSSEPVRSESRISRLVRGEVDFSQSRFNDPMLWILLKDFWSKMRNPLQFWKYVYVVVGTIFALYLNIIQPAWFPSVRIPPELGYAIIPAFLLILVLMTQMASLSALLSFIDERDNIYLLKSSPFRSGDIVLAKYILSVFEVSLTSLPIFGLLIYFFDIQGSLALVTLAAPLVLIFCASGVMTGAYTPVFTNEPKNPPVPLAFSFPAINLVMGALLMLIVSIFSGSLFLLLVLPIYTLGSVVFFLALAIVALRSYK
jgi:hypothetical protein